MDDESTTLNDDEVESTANDPVATVGDDADGDDTDTTDGDADDSDSSDSDGDDTDSDDA